MRAPFAATALGYAGLIPFAAAAAVAAFGDAEAASMAGDAAFYYGAAILSFMGGCRWGFAAAGLGEGPRFAPLAISVAPALLAWAALLLSANAGVAWTSLMLIGGFIALYADDVRATLSGGAPKWWSALRAPLTAGACASLAATAAWAP